MASSPRALVARIKDSLYDALSGTLVPPYVPRTMKPPEAMTAVDYLHEDARLPLVMICDVMGKRRDLASQSGSIDLSDPAINSRTYATGQTTLTLNRLPLNIYRLIPDEAVVEVTIRVIG